VTISNPCQTGEDYCPTVLVAFVIWNRSSLFPWGKAAEDQLEKGFLSFCGGIAIIFCWTGIYCPWQEKGFICSLVLRRWETP